MPLPGPSTPGLVWMGIKNLAPAGIRSLGRPTCSKSLYWLHYPGLKIVQTFIILWYIRRGSVSTSLLWMPFWLVPVLSVVLHLISLNDWCVVFFLSDIMWSFHLPIVLHCIFGIHTDIFLWRLISLPLWVVCSFSLLGHTTLIYLLINYLGHIYAILSHNKITNNL